MRSAIIGTFVFLSVMFGIIQPASAAGYGDGKPASKSAQKAACKGLKGATHKSCVKLAKLPSWWMHVNGTNVQKPNGVVIIKAIKGKNPVTEYKSLFDHNIKLYKDNHATIQA